MTLDLGNRLPSFAIVEDAAHHDSVRAAELTAHLRRGDIAVADRAYTDFGFMNGLDSRGVWFVTRQKRNMKMKVVRRIMEPVAATGERKTQILADEIVVPAKKSTAAVLSSGSRLPACRNGTADFVKRQQNREFSS